jgi:hypothetical protein
VNVGFNMNEATTKGYAIWMDNYYNLKNNCFNFRKYSHKAKTIKIDKKLIRNHSKEVREKKLIFPH